MELQFRVSQDYINMLLIEEGELHHNHVTLTLIDAPESLRTALISDDDIRFHKDPVGAAAASARRTPEDLDHVFLMSMTPFDTPCIAPIVIDTPTWESVQTAINAARKQRDIDTEETKKEEKKRAARQRAMEEKIATDAAERERVNKIRKHEKAAYTQKVVQRIGSQNVADRAANGVLPVSEVLHLLEENIFNPLSNFKAYEPITEMDICRCKNKRECVCSVYPMCSMTAEQWDTFRDIETRAVNILEGPVKELVTVTVMARVHDARMECCDGRGTRYGVSVRARIGEYSEEACPGNRSEHIYTITREYQLPDDKVEVCKL